LVAGLLHNQESHYSRDESLRLYFINSWLPYILIPAYRPFVIKEPLIFSEILQPLYIYGVTHNSEPYVQLNLPETEKDMLYGVKIWQKPSSFWGDF